MTYIVEPGDTITSIAEKFKIRVEDLIRENNLQNTYFLVPGIELIIPSVNNNQNINTEQFDYYVVSPGDNLYQIGLKYGLTAEVLSELNGLELNEYIFPNQKIKVPKQGVGVYITKEEDTLNMVANDLNISVEDLLRYNKNIYLLPGQLIIYQKRQS